MYQLTKITRSELKKMLGDPKEMLGDPQSGAGVAYHNGWTYITAGGCDNKYWNSITGEYCFDYYAQDGIKYHKLVGKEKIGFLNAIGNGFICGGAVAGAAQIGYDYGGRCVQWLAMIFAALLAQKFITWMGWNPSGESAQDSRPVSAGFVKVSLSSEEATGLICDLDANGKITNSKSDWIDVGNDNIFNIKTGEFLRALEIEDPPPYEAWLLPTNPLVEQKAKI